LEIEVTSVVEIDVDKIVNMRDNDDFWKFAAMEWHRLYSPYVPMDTGALMDSVEFEPKTIIHTQPYAHYLYEGEVYGPNYAIKKNGVVTGFRSPAGVPKTPTGRPLNYSHVMHGLASAEWDKAAVPAQMDALVSALQNYIDGGGGVLGR
jgi:hypothetical protein